MAFAPNWKPPKGTALMERRQKRKQIVLSEHAEKEKVRKRDKTCIWPKCENCRQFKPRIEAAHGEAKGMGGDHGLRSTADNMSLLDFLTHQGPRSIHSGHKRIRPLTDRGHNGPRACEERETTDGSSPWLLVGVVL